MAGAVKLPTVDGGVNRRQNLRFLIPHHSPLYTLQGKCTDRLKGRPRDQLQVGITRRGTRGGNAPLKGEQGKGSCMLHNDDQRCGSPGSWWHCYGHAWQ